MNQMLETTHQKPAAGVGLVLSGGGAKGAYQAGVLRALSECGIEAGMLAGASIGALNGALVAAAASQQEAVAHLQELWSELADVSPIQFSVNGVVRTLRLPAYLVGLGSFGLPIRGLSLLTPLAQMLGASFSAAASQGQEGLLCDERIRRLIDRYLPDTGLPQRVPLYVSVYPTDGVALDFLKLAGATFGITESRQSRFLHVQSLPPQEQKKALLASAALPLLFAPQEVQGQRYTDGGQGGWRSVQGNTPIQPLLDAGCRHVVVTHLMDGSLWDRHQFPQASIIEIRPAGQGIQRKGAVQDVLGFDNSLIPGWMAQGYDDTMACMSRIKEAVSAHAALDAAKARMNAQLSHTGEAALQAAMQRLRNS